MIRRSRLVGAKRISQRSSRYCASRLEVRRLYETTRGVRRLDAFIFKGVVFMNSVFRPRQVYMAASWMAPVGRYNGKDKENLSFLEMAERCGEVFDESPVRRRDIEAVVVGSQNPAAFSGVDNTAAKIAGILGISGAKSVLIDTASSSGASAFENAYLEVAS